MFINIRSQIDEIYLKFTVKLKDKYISSHNKKGCITL